MAGKKDAAILQQGDSLQPLRPPTRNQEDAAKNGRKGTEPYTAKDVGNGVIELLNVDRVEKGSMTCRARRRIWVVWTGK